MSKIMEYQNTMLCGDMSGGYSTKTPCIGEDDSIPEWLRKNVEKKLRDCFKELDMQTVNILGNKYTIKHAEIETVKVFEDEIADAFCDCTSREIIIRSIKDDEDIGNKQNYINRLLRHEVIHAYMFESGLGAEIPHPPTGHDEAMIDWFARMAPRIMQTFIELDIAELN